MQDNRIQSVNKVIDLVAQRPTLNSTATTAQSLSAKQKLKLADAWQVLLSRRLVTDPIGSDAHLVFERDMADMTTQQIDMGLLKSRDFTGFFTTPAFREMCKVTAQDLGLPDVMSAMREACCAPYPKDQHQWSHPAVYLAGCAVGWFDMQNKTERELFPIFEQAYDALIKRVMNGEALSMPIPKALPKEVHIPATPERARSAINKLKEMLA